MQQHIPTKGRAPAKAGGCVRALKASPSCCDQTQPPVPQGTLAWARFLASGCNSSAPTSGKHSGKPFSKDGRRRPQYNLAPKGINPMGACRCNAACNRVRVRNQARTPASFGPANGVRNIREFRTEALVPAVVPNGTQRGTRYGRVAARNGSFRVGQRDGIPPGGLTNYNPTTAITTNP